MVRGANYGTVVAMTDQPRITGTEMEWAIWKNEGAADSNLLVPLGNMGNLVTRHLPENVWSTGVIGFLSNGARYYRDFGEHVEYATPEDTSFWGTVTNEIAGEQIVRASLQALVEEKILKSYILSKQLIDDNGKTWGHHENYLVSSKNVEITPQKLALLGIHLATRNIFTGAGGVIRHGKNKTSFSVSQKAVGLHTDFSGNTAKDKPVVNLRDEPHAGPEWKRVHVTSGDANMSPWAMWMSLGTTSIVLRLIESRISLKELALPPAFTLTALAKQVARDTSLRSNVKLANREIKTPLGIQESLLEAAHKYRSMMGLPDEESQVLDEWERIISDLKRGPIEATADRVEWVARLYMLTTEQARLEGLPSQEIMERILKVDKLWGEIGPRGLGEKLRQGTWNTWMPSETKVEAAITTPPTTTRATVRGDFIKRTKGHQSVDWASASCKDNRKVKLAPYQTDTPPILTKLYCQFTDEDVW
jgi:hypothetical protein